MSTVPCGTPAPGPSEHAEKASHAPRSGERATPFYCPYCGDEDLRPEIEPHAAWLCGSCRRVFTVKFVGLNLGASKESAQVNR